MLKNRDQWVRAFPLVEDVDWDEVRGRLEKPFRREVRRALEEVYRLLHTEPALARELVEMAAYAAGNCAKFGLLWRMEALPHPDQLAVEHWECLADFVLTGGKWRKKVDVRHGFPPKAREKLRMESLLERLQEIRGLREAFAGVEELPRVRYDDGQWETLRHLFMTLRRAVAELNVIFAETN